MNTPKLLPRFILIAIVLLGVPALILGALGPSQTVRADELPPRPVTPMPIATPVPFPVEGGLNGASHATNQALPDTASIELQGSALHVGQFSVVQWQDPQKGWHDVEGWQAAVSATGGVRWDVYPRDFNTGPFRWAVYATRNGKLVWASEAFHLPCCLGETVIRVCR